MTLNLLILTTSRLCKIIPIMKRVTIVNFIVLIFQIIHDLAMTWNMPILGLTNIIIAVGNKIHTNKRSTLKVKHKMSYHFDYMKPCISY